MAKIGIVGYGYVGKAMARFFAGHYDVYLFDPYIEHWDADRDGCRGMTVCNSPAGINDCDAVFICVPTPQADNGSCDTSIVERVLGWLRAPLVVIKSTVPVGLTDRAYDLCDHGDIVFSPEYCGESWYFTPPPYDFVTDVAKEPFYIFGGPPVATSRCVDLYLPVAGPCKRYIQTTARAAELAKYLENAYYAMKVAWCYEMAETARALGVDWNAVRELWLADPRLTDMHTAVFAGQDRPFGGKCLPKDTAALLAQARAADYDPGLVQAVLDANDRLAKLRAARRG